MRKHERNSYFKALASRGLELPEQLAARNMDERELMKYAVVEELPFSLTEVLAGSTPDAAAEAKQGNGTLLIVLYQQEADERPVYYSLPLAGATVR